MANKYLISKEFNKVLSVVDADEVFEVHESLEWVSGPDLEEGKTSGDYQYSSESGITLIAEIKLSYDFERKLNYPSFNEQLDQLWHDLDNGTIPGKDTSLWYKSIKEIKEQFPKE
jgi:hypothetical protein